MKNCLATRYEKITKQKNNAFPEQEQANTGKKLYLGNGVPNFSPLCPRYKKKQNIKKIMPIHNRNRVMLAKHFIWEMGGVPNFSPPCIQPPTTSQP
jgi:hypothetical protein